ncbi:LacI family DNA-binding transcriptional regulator [Microbacterium sp. SYP-A9085]|uniref:LacI family DNA-binding transcriptional regulator n=1 Tax=Microbacterium sp. SYP-A9085 TaxID=2664454 RepID=UPI001C12C22B|nr:LacI family DNA-binding transcriptional regulator [Microbacterium sp. SYP-A9085]
MESIPLQDSRPHEEVKMPTTPSERRHAVTIEEVAARAGVSKATASRVLSGHPATSEQSRARVTAAARELDFQPNAQARSLRSARTGTMGVLIPDVRNMFFAELVHGVEQEALARGYVNVLGNADESVSQQDAFLEALMRQRVDGVIIAPIGDGSGAITRLLSRRIPVVFVDRVLPGVGGAVPAITTDSAQGLGEAIAHLRAHGHRRIGFIAGPQATSTGRERLELFRRLMAENALPLREDHIVIGDFQPASGARGIDILLGTAEAPTAIITADSPMTAGAVSRLHERGMRPGHDIDLVAFDDIDWFALLDPPLSVIAHSAPEMGRRAVQALCDVIEGRTPDSHVLPSTFIARGPLAEAPTGKAH